MIPLTRRHRRVVFDTAVVLSRKPHPSFLRYCKSPSKQHDCQIRFSSSSDLPPSSQENRAGTERQGDNMNILSNGLNAGISNISMMQQSENSRRIEQGKNRHLKLGNWQQKNARYSPSLVKSSQYSFRRRQTETVDRAAPDVLQSMNASAVLDPLNFCKVTAKSPPYVYGGSRSINGSDAARRLLRGKKEFLSAVRQLNNAPVLLDGHGVPPALFQHSIDMADALLRHYGPDIIECSFHNYHNENKSSCKTPLHVRVRRRDATNLFLPSPCAIDTDESDCENTKHKGEESCGKIDWDHNLTLYLTVMVSL